MNTIWERYRQLEKERREFHSQATEQYDKNVYLPAKLALQRECGESEEGHRFGSSHDNGIGWSWSYCSKCGGRYNIEGPEVS